jgi:hypothetical protein
MCLNMRGGWPGDEDERGTVYLRDLWADAADRRGFLLAGCALSMNSSVYGPGYRFTWEDPGARGDRPPTCSWRTSSCPAGPGCSSTVTWPRSCQASGRVTTHLLPTAAEGATAGDRLG